MITYSAALTLVGLVVTVGVGFTGLLFHWLRGDIQLMRIDLMNHMVEHTKDKG